MSNFWRGYLPFFLNFLIGRAITQTDLVMSSWFGPSAVVAFGLPSRIMILDTVVAFALAPAFSVLIAKAKPQDRQELANDFLSCTFWIGIGVSSLGLLIYPFLIKAIAVSPDSAALATRACLYLTLCIPFRLQQFAATMILHGTGKGQLASILMAASLVLNIFLNYLAAIVFGMGPTGIYVATVTVAVFMAIISCLIITDHRPNLCYRVVPRSFFMHVINLVKPEVGRLIVERMVALTAISFFAVFAAPESAAAGFVICSELLLLLSAPLIAMLRTNAIRYASRSGDTVSFWRDEFLLLVLLLSVSILLCANVTYFFERAYGITKLNWWYKSFAFCLPGLLLARWANNLTRTHFQIDQQFSTLFRLDLALQIGFLIPVFGIAIANDRPALVWCAILLADALSFFILRSIRDRSPLIPRQYGSHVTP